MAKLWLTISLALGSLFATAQEQTRVDLPADSLIIILNRDSVERQHIIDSIEFAIIEVEESQEDRKQRKALEDSLKRLNRSFLRDFGVIVDYGKFIGFIADFEEKYEFGARLTFGNNIFIGAEYGWGTIKPPDAYVNTNYEANGNYYRLMAGIIGPLDAKTNIGFGASYAIGSYSDMGAPVIESPSGLFDVPEEPFARDNINATWYELNLISETVMLRNLYLGLHLRFRIMGDYDVQEPL
ncbi:MAG: DUF6048 family protein, partial [Bacteroidota bacterium]